MPAGVVVPAVVGEIRVLGLGIRLGVAPVAVEYVLPASMSWRAFNTARSFTA
jgi:hypothetical protein